MISEVSPLPQMYVVYDPARQLFNFKHFQVFVLCPVLNSWEDECIRWAICIVSDISGIVRH